MRVSDMAPWCVGGAELPSVVSVLDANFARDPLFLITCIPRAAFSRDRCSVRCR